MNGECFCAPDDRNPDYVRPVIEAATAAIPAPGSVGWWSLLFDGGGHGGTDSIAVTGAINGGTSTVIIVDCGSVEPLDVGATWMIVGQRRR